MAGCTDTWFNQTLTQVNDAVIRLGIIEGEFHFHAHDEEDEFFLVLEGQIWMDLKEGKTVEHHHEERSHQGKNNVLLSPRRDHATDGGEVKCEERLGGLLKFYYREAA